jgi:HlyD family type I secretion membrane fusion protein
MGLITIAVFFGGFGLWSTLAPLASAVLASGVVILDANSKTIQHLEGGIITAIHVREGQYVEQGELMVNLSDIQSKAASEVLNIRYLTGLAERARLIAERDAEVAINFPSELFGDPAILLELRSGQTSIFESRRLSVVSQTEILNQRIAQLREQIIGLENSIEAQLRQASLIDEEKASVQVLVDRGSEGRSPLRALEMSAAELDQEISESRANVAQIGEKIGETHLLIEDVSVSALKEATEKLRDVEEVILNSQERLVASRDILRRTEVLAPVAGQVMELTVSTIGGVVQPGEPLLTIVPTNAPLVVEVQIRPTDIEDVYPGLIAQVRLTAFSFRTTPLMEGVVESVSADSVEDQRSGALYYKARIRLPLDVADILGGSKTIIPGMPADVQIQTSSRTLLDYLISPILSQLEVSFLEK